MDDDKKFQQRWEFRRKEIDGDSSSDDNRSNPSGPPPNPITDLVLLENEDNPECHTNRDKENLKAAKNKKIKSVEQRKKSNACSVKKKKRKTSLKKNEETVMLNDLKVFANSVIQELTSARENMFEHMRDEMGKLAAKKNRVTKPRNVKSNVGPDAVKTTKDDVYLRVLATAAHMNPANPSDQVTSSSYLTLPTVFPKPQFHNPSLIDGLKFHNRFAEFRPEERPGSFSQTSNSVAFPVPVSRGMDIGSNISGLTYSNIVGPMMNGVEGFPRGSLAPSDQMLAYGNMARKSDGEFISVRPQEFREGQFYTSSLRNRQ
ncbi:hypothetical protein CASFOL_020118 [Castilleja foliolosa]|uniref:Uncharacterized protein n=1 Tax=Castilleja foliolosa TaxID=1961234 RepID=A0ABD3CZY1_9LAMI